MTAKIYITLKPGVLDPQGQAVGRSLARLGYDEATDVRVGKYIELRLSPPDDAKHGAAREEAAARVERMCRELLANTVIEDYRFELVD